MTYTPSTEILTKYADLLVNYALGGGVGVRRGEVVMISVPECAKPFYVPLRQAVIMAGGHAIMQYLPDDVDPKAMFEASSEDQLQYFAEHYYGGIVQQIDHHIVILSDADLHELEGVDPKKMLMKASAQKLYREWRNAKEAAGKFTWTLAMYGTPAMAAEVGMSEEEYWQQIITACFLEAEDPKQKWRETDAALQAIKQKLNALAIEKLHVVAEGIDLWVKLGSDRQWLGGSGRNIPSFELFISPDWRGTEGVISFNEPLYYMGSLIEGISLRFEQGQVVEVTASRNQELLQEMIGTENADKIGEFSLTDGRYSHITKLMGETLFDENRGGEQGNTHIAVGNAYQDSYPGDASALTQEQWAELGYNQSVVHTDIISTAQRTVTAYLLDGSERVIYDNGQFTL